MTITPDFETRSMVNLKKCGAWIYSRDPSTVVLCLGWCYDDDVERVYLWHPAFPAIGLPEEGRVELIELHQRIRDGEVLEAHNAFFERSIWRNVMVRQGWPEVGDDQWRCTAAKAASFSLPRNLEGACDALGLKMRKDVAGKRAMLRLSQPRRPTKGDPYSPWVYDPTDFQVLFDYNRSDVRAQAGLGQALRDLPPDELAAWRLDQEINTRGMYCDRELARKALAITQDAVQIADQEIHELSLGLVKNARARAQFLPWLHSLGVEIPNTQAATIDDWVTRPEVTGDARRALEVWRRANRSSTKKYEAMLARADRDDGRIRDLLRYHGAERTGRWAGVGIQPQNLPRGEVKAKQDELARDIVTLDYHGLEALYGDPMAVLSTAVRGALCAAPGFELFAADYAAIEARGVFWIADDLEALEVFRTGADMYRALAGEVFGRKPSEFAKDSMERKLGKEGILGLGYQMGPPKFRARCAASGIDIDEQFSERVVEAYRTRHRRVVEFWRAIEDAAKLAVVNGRGAPPVQIAGGRIRWAVRGRFLHCRLPSGRLLSYCDPRLGRDEKFGRLVLMYDGLDQRTHKWGEQRTYGGKLTENVVQALCRDLLRDAMLRAAATPPYERVVLTVHDEAVSEVPEGRGDLREFEALIAQTEPWAAGMPVVAEGWRGRRFRK